MNRTRFMRQMLFILSLSFIAAVVLGQAMASEYQPQVGQQGKDVIWVPTCQALVDRMLDIAKVTPQDYVIDLGSGDGRTVITAAKRGIRALGIEYNPDMVEFSKNAASKEGVAERAQFVKADIFETDFSQATVITMFLLPDINVRLRPKILDLKPGTRIVSNTFTMAEWEPDQTATVESSTEDCGFYHTALLWIVPAKVEGTWRLPQGEIKFSQSFQMISGALRSGNRTTTFTNGKLQGDQITFSVGNAAYTGRVNGNSMEGTVSSGGNNSPWSATKAGK